MSDSEREYLDGFYQAHLDLDDWEESYQYQFQGEIPRTRRAYTAMLVSEELHYRLTDPWSAGYQDGLTSSVGA